MTEEINKARLKVACAIIEKEGKVLAAQRSEFMHLPLKWEFPGGKIAVNEKADECILREIKEELGLNIQIIKALKVYIFISNSQEIELFPFICKITSGELELLEHKQVSWEYPSVLPTLEWAPADIPVLNDYLKGI